MYKNEIKTELKAIYEGTKKVDSELIGIKVAIHNLQKLGYNTKDLEHLLDNIGIELYKYKNELYECFGIKARV